jgi:hypothetical protein
MTTAHTALLVKFRANDTKNGVSRRMVKAMAAEMGVSETQVIHIALAQYAEENMPICVPDNGPLTGKQITALRKDAAKHMSSGKVTYHESLFNENGKIVFKADGRGLGVVLVP